MNARIAAFLATSLIIARPITAAGADVSGEKVFLKCQACHTVDGGKGRIGPDLQGVIGRMPGDFGRASDAMNGYGEANGPWTEEALDKFLEDPRGTVPGNRMAFPGIRDSDDRQAVIQFLLDNPKP